MKSHGCVRPTLGAAWAAADLTAEADGTAIVQPARLNPALSSQVCGQCRLLFLEPLDAGDDGTKLVFG